MTEDRQQQGTKAQRRKLPAGVRIRYGLAIIISLIAAYGAWQANRDSDRLSRDEHQTCVIQARGLPAGHELAASMRDVHTLLTFPPSPGSPPVPQPIQQVVTSLNTHLAAYLKAEASQPAQRQC